MTDSLVVLMGDRVAGTLVRRSGGALELAYEDSYRDLASSTPLSVSMPTSVRVHRDRPVRAWLWGLLPDNEAVLGRWSRQFHVSTASPFGLLSTPVGLDCPGAVRFVPPTELDAALALPGHIEWLSEEDVAARLRELRADETAWLGRDFAGRFSLAGAQAKTALCFVDRRWGLPSGAAATTHILKPAIAGLDDHDLNEHLCLRAAALAGLPTVRTSIQVFASECAIVVERYDRRRTHDGVLRIHQEDLCQASGVAPAEKYQADGGPGPERVVSILRRTMPPSIAEAAVRRFADALVWNWLIAGTDAHAKNYALLLSGAQVRLAPFYDIASALPYGVHERRLQLAMKLGDDYRLHVQRPSTWPAASAQLGLPVDELEERARRLVELAPAAFHEAASEELPVDSDLPPRLAHAVEARAGRCARALA